MSEYYDKNLTNNYWQTECVNLLEKREFNWGLYDNLLFSKKAKMTSFFLKDVLHSLQTSGFETNFLLSG